MREPASPACTVPKTKLSISEAVLVAAAVSLRAEFGSEIEGINLLLRSASHVLKGREEAKLLLDGSLK